MSFPLFMFVAYVTPSRRTTQALVAASGLPGARAGSVTRIPAAPPSGAQGSGPPS